MAIILLAISGQKSQIVTIISVTVRDRVISTELSGHLDATSNFAWSLRSWSDTFLCGESLSLYVVEVQQRSSS